MSAVLHHANIYASAKLVLMGIANHQGDQGAYPSIETLARYAGVSRRSVSTYLRDLQDAGYIHVEEQAGRNGTNIYYVTIDCPDECDRTTNHRTLKGMKHTSYPMQNLHTPHEAHFIPPMQTVAYKPSYNRQLTNTEIEEKIRLDRLRRQEQAQRIVNESRKAMAEAVDSPTCLHGKSLVLCDICCAALASNQRN